MFGVDDAAIATVGAAAIGGVSSWLGQSNANKDNLRIARETNRMNWDINNLNNAFNERMAGNMMAFQRDMAGTAISRRVQDLKASGLNPLLAITSGMGGASPSGGASASASTIPMQTGAAMQSPASGISGSLANALQAFRIKSELENLVASNDKIRADTRLANQAAETSKRQAELNANNSRKVLADISQVKAATKQTTSLTDQLKTQLPRAKTVEAFNKSLPGKASTVIGEFFRALNPFVSTASTASRMAK